MIPSLQGLLRQVEQAHVLPPLSALPVASVSPGGADFEQPLARWACDVTCGMRSYSGISVEQKLVSTSRACAKLRRVHPTRLVDFAALI